MSRRRVAVALITVLVLMVAAATALNAQDEDVIPTAVVGIWLVGVGTIGALIAASKDGNRIGWLMLTIPLFITGGLVGEAYASYALEVLREPLPFDRAAAWASLWLTVPGFALFVCVFLLFPTGRLPSSRWRFVMWATIGATALQVAYLMVKPGPIDNVPGIDNPLGAPDLALILLPLTNVGQTVLIACGFAAIASLVMRFRRAGGIERQQIKTVAAGSMALPVCFTIVIVLDAITQVPEGAGETDWIGFLINMIGLSAIPISIGLAILRYRLYDIDVIINRALVYSILTAILAGAYVALVVAFQGMLRPLTEQSDVAVAASTLAVAALFGPVRGRVQSFIDKRFYRSRYDAQQTLENFSARLRDEVELERIRLLVVSVVHQTVRPAHAQLWLQDSRSGVTP